MSDFRRRSGPSSELRSSNEGIGESRESKERRLLNEIAQARSDESLVTAMVTAIDAGIRHRDVQNAVKRYLATVPEASKKNVDKDDIVRVRRSLVDVFGMTRSFGTDVIPEGRWEHSVRLSPSGIQPNPAPTALPSTVTAAMEILADLESSPIPTTQVLTELEIQAQAHMREVGRKMREILANASSSEEGAKALGQFARELGKTRPENFDK